MSNPYVTKISGSNFPDKHAIVLIPGLGEGVGVWSRLLNEIDHPTNYDILFANTPWMDKKPDKKMDKTPDRKPDRKQDKKQE